MSAPMPGWLREILTDADSAGDIASTLILAAADLIDGKATTADMYRWGREIRGDMRDNHAELAAPPSDVAPVVWRVTGAPTYASPLMIGQRYRVVDGQWRWLNGDSPKTSMYAGLAAMLAAGYVLEMELAGYEFAALDGPAEEATRDA